MRTTEGKRQLRRRRRGWQGNIKMDLKRNRLVAEQLSASRDHLYVAELTADLRLV